VLKRDLPVLARRFMNSDTQNRPQEVTFPAKKIDDLVGCLRRDFDHLYLIIYAEVSVEVMLS